MLVPCTTAVLIVPSAFGRGLMLGGSVVAVIGLLSFWVVQVTGTASTMMGDLAERWTACELRKLRRSGWRVVNHVALHAWDIDHVLVGPGGAFAVETKWSSHEWELVPPGERVRAAVRQAQGNARSLRLWQPFKAAGISVQPVVMLWGGGLGALDDAPPVRDVDGTAVVLGPFADRWRSGLPSGVLGPGQVDTAWRALDKFMEGRDPREQVTERLPLSVAGIGARATLAFTAALAGALATAQIGQLTGSLYWTDGLSLLLSVPAIVLIRARRFGYLAWPWAIGLIGTSVGITVYVLAIVLLK
jgi:hypothetical protein